MRKGYLIAHIDVKDMEAYQGYIERAHSIFAKYSATPLARGGPREQAEGPSLGSRVVILEFPTFEQAKECYFSKEYQQIAEVRFQSAESTVVLVEGL